MMRQKRFQMSNVFAWAAGVLFATAPVAWGQNLLVNPSFDDSGGSLDGWIAFGNAFPELGIVNSAPGSAKIFGNFSGGFNVTGILQAFPALPGDAFVMEGKSFVASGDLIPPATNWAVMKIAFFDAPSGGSEIGFSETIIADSTVAPDMWHDNITVGVAPIGTQRVEALFLYLQPAFDGGAVFIDDTSFRPLPPNMLANASFDALGGSLDGWNFFANAYPDTAIFFSPPASGKMFGAFSGGFGVTGIFQVFPAAAGEKHIMATKAFIGSFDGMIGAGPPNDNWAVMKLAYFDAPSGGTEIGFNEVIIGDGFTAQDAWLDNAVSAVAPAGTQRVEAFFLYLQPGTDGGSIFMDNSLLAAFPVQACCLPGDSCQELNTDDCFAAGGTPQGDGVACNPALCLPAGACCNPANEANNLCTDSVLPGDCVDPGLTHFPGQTCAEVQASGACVAVPAISEWGLAMLTLFGCIGGTIMFRNSSGRSRAAA